MAAIIAATLIASVWLQGSTLEDRFFDSNGVRIRYVEEGRGPAVVLIHGYTGNGDRHWVNTGVFASLAADHRVIAIDCRGHGKSAKLRDPAAYGAEMSRDVVRLLDHLDIRRAHVVGFSMGAFIAGHLMASEPDRLLSATLVAHHPIRTWTAADERETEAEARDLESDTPFRSLIVGVSPPGSPPAEAEIRKLSQALAAANDPAALSAYHRGRRTLAVTDASLKAVRVPVLAVIGSDDPSIAGVKDLQRIMPRLSLVVIEDATHGGERGVLRRGEFLYALRTFLWSAASLQDSRQAAIGIVTTIQRADYEGDRPALARLHAELAPLVETDLASRVLYWRGFAMWRRALNGFNDGAPREELERNLTQCTADFRAALARDPAFADARIGAASCLVNHSFLNLKTDRRRAGELYVESASLLKEAAAASPDNPRLFWVQGANQWYAPPNSGGGQEVALAIYAKGLDLARRAKGRSADPLDPSWGEAELLMNLAFANLNQATPDLAAAEEHARAALALVPYWHYVRDILLPQIQRAKAGK